VTITFAAPSFYADFYSQLAGAFHSGNPNITVQVITTPGDSQAWSGDDLYGLASAADTSFSYSNQPLRQSSALFLDLEPLLENDPAFPADDFWPGTLAACQDANGKTLGLPLSVNLSGIAYNPAAFDQAGLPYPAPGWTWDEFNRDLAALGGSQQLAYLDSQEFFTSLLAARLDEAVANGDPANEIVAGYLQAVQNQSLRAFDESQTYSQRQDLLANSHPAMWAAAMGAGSATTNAQGAIVETPDTNIAPFPVNAAGDQTTPAGVRCAMISNGSQHPREAWQWLEYLSGRWLATAEESDRLQLIPARPSTAEKSGYWDALGPDLEPAVRLGLNQAWYGPADPQTYLLLKQATNEALQGTGDFDAAFKTAQQAALAQPSATPDTRLAAVAPAQPVQPQGGPGQITFFDDSIPPTDLQNLAATFESAHPQIQIEMVTDSSSYNFQDIRLANYSANFDCFSGMSGYANNPLLMDESQLYPLDPWLESDPALSADFYPGQLDLYRPNGVTLGLPVTRDIPTLSYNAGLLQTLGIPAPSNQWTFDDFTSAITAVAAAGSAGGPYYGYAMSSDSLLLAGRGLDFSDPLNFDFTQADAASTAEWLAGLAQSEAVARNPADDPNHLAQLVAAGQVAFWDTSLNGWFFNGSQPAFQTGEVVFPATLNPFGANSVTGFYISAQAQNPQACWDWIAYLSAQPAAEETWPARKSVAASADWQARVGPQKAGIFQAAENRAPAASSAGPERLALQQIWNAGMAQIYAGAAPQNALAEAQAQLDQYTTCLASAGYPNLEGSRLADASQACLTSATHTP
jgi:ABC-type glycerol-3-phosphate transport system substrate-binding protein